MASSTKGRKKHLPLATGVVIGCILFITILSGLSTLISYNVSKNTLYTRYQAQMTSIIDYVEGFIDHDDMYECVQTQTESAKYKETQKVFDDLALRYLDLHYIYALRPVDDARGAVSIISGNTPDEYENDSAVRIGDGGEDWFTPDAIKHLKNAFAGDEDVFFFEDSNVWGSDYTLARPIKNTAGQTYGLLCVDISVATIDQAIQKIVLYSLSLIVGIGFIFTVVLILWMHFFIIRPVKKLQKSVSDYAKSAHNTENPEEMVFVAPKVLASREILDLSDSVETLKNDMRNYVTNILEKEEEVQTLHTSIEEMDVVAYKDALTGVKNKAAYDRDVAVINEKIINNEDIEFAVVMVDANDLKVVNDTHGHESGDIYIKGICSIICGIYAHSPVYRIGGDEIVVILQGEDYQGRDRLLRRIKKEFAFTSRNEKEKGYNRYSAAVGMGVFVKGSDEEFYTVFRRADKQMYSNKADIKKQ